MKYLERIKEINYFVTLDSLLFFYILKNDLSKGNKIFNFFFRNIAF